MGKLGKELNDDVITIRDIKELEDVLKKHGKAIVKVNNNGNCVIKPITDSDSDLTERNHFYTAEEVKNAADRVFTALSEIKELFTPKETLLGEAIHIAEPLSKEDVKDAFKEALDELAVDNEDEDGDDDSCEGCAQADRCAFAFTKREAVNDVQRTKSNRDEDKVNFYEWSDGVKIPVPDESLREIFKVMDKVLHFPHPMLV